MLFKILFVTDLLTLLNLVYIAINFWVIVFANIFPYLFFCFCF